MKKNNPRKPFFGSDKQEGEGASNKKSPRGSSFSKKENSSDSGKGKFFGKKEGAAEKKPFEKRNAEGATNRGASKGRFFKEQLAGTGEGRPSRGDKSSDWKEKKNLEGNSTSLVLVQPVVKNLDSRKGSIRSPLLSQKIKEGEPIFRRIQLP